MNESCIKGKGVGGGGAGGDLVLIPMTPYRALLSKFLEYISINLGFRFQKIVACSRLRLCKVNYKHCDKVKFFGSEVEF